MVYHRHPGKIKNVREHNPLIKFRWELVQSSQSKGVILSDCTKEPYFFAQSELSLSFVVEINQEGRGLEVVEGTLKSNVNFGSVIYYFLQFPLILIFCFAFQKWNKLFWLALSTQKSNFGGLCPIVSRGSSDLYKVV